MPEWKALKECGLFDALSQSGKDQFLPPGIFHWAGRAKKEAEINATIGSAFGPAEEIGLEGGNTVFYLPTLAALLGLPLPDRPYDGIDIMPLLKGERQERGRAIGFYFRDAVALSGERYKLIAAAQLKGRRSGGAVDFKGKTFELFDLTSDPGEKTNLHDNPERAKIRATFEQRLHEFFAAHSDPLWNMWKPDGPSKHLHTKQRPTRP